MIEKLPPLTPRAADGKPFTLPSIFPFEMILNFAGKPDANGQRYGGNLFGLEQVGAGNKHLDFQFQDGVFITGGNVMWSGGGYGSYVTLEMFAPASTVVDPDEPNTGNCNLIPTGLGFNMIVPANGDGAKNLGTIIPITAERDDDLSSNGYWDYTDPWLGIGDLTPGEPGAAKFNLFDTALPLCHFCDIHLVMDTGIREAVLQSIKPKWILPQWFLRVILTNAHANKTLQAGWDLVLARKQSI